MSLKDEALAALDKTNGNKSKAARLLGISRSAFRDRLDRPGAVPDALPGAQLRSRLRELELLVERLNRSNRSAKGSGH